jgi:hypothetical protein
MGLLNINYRRQFIGNGPLYKALPRFLCSIIPFRLVFRSFNLGRVFNYKLVHNDGCVCFIDKNIAYGIAYQLIYATGGIAASVKKKDECGTDKHTPPLMIDVFHKNQHNTHTYT